MCVCRVCVCGDLLIIRLLCLPRRIREHERRLPVPPFHLDALLLHLFERFKQREEPRELPLEALVGREPEQPRAARHLLLEEVAVACAVVDHLAEGAPLEEREVEAVAPPSVGIDSAPFAAETGAGADASPIAAGPAARRLVDSLSLLALALELLLKLALQLLGRLRLSHSLRSTLPLKLLAPRLRGPRLGGLLL